MIPTIIIVSIALAWLMVESDFLRVDLMGNQQTTKLKLIQCPVKTLELTMPKPLLMLDTVHFKPSLFEALDMPEFTGDVNIVCRRD